MDRRTFLTVSAVATALPRPRLATPTLPLTGRPGLQGQLRFQLDEARRWSLDWLGGSATRIVDSAVLAIALDGRMVPLAELEEARVEPRDTPLGPATAVRGRVAGAIVDVEFAVAPPSAAGPEATITVTISPETSRPVIGGVRYADCPTVSLLSAGAGDSSPLTFVANGYHSWSRCSVQPIGPGLPEMTGYATGALTRDGKSLALAFGAGEPGDGVIRHAAGRVEVKCDWIPARPIAPDGDVVALRLGFAESGDPFERLRRLLAPPPAASDQPARLATAAAPAGWCSWYELFDRVTEADVLANLDFCATHFGSRSLRYIQIDDGYQKAAGDWDTNDKFPHGHRWLTDQVHARGFLAGLWIAPFAVTDASGIPVAHPEWLLRKGNGPLLKGTSPGWGGSVYALDPAHPDVQQWLTTLARRVVRDWGYDYLKIDFLLYGTEGDAHAGGLTHAEAYRQGLQAIRRGLGDEVFLLGCGAPLQHAAGLVDGMRIGEDVSASWGGIQPPARATALRGYYHRTTWFNDPDCLVVRPPLTLPEARAWASIVASSGGMTLISDNLPKLPEDRIALLQRTLPAAAVTGRAVDAGASSPEVAPALVAGDTVVSLPATWSFRTGDAADYATREYDESVWETIPVPSTWEAAGHPGYDGIAWYRTRFVLPAQPAAPAVLELGRLDDADETYVNGALVGRTGAFPPSYQSAWEAYRRYRVPAEALNWGGENVVAIRVYDGGGDGGYWSVRRDRPPARWLVEGAPQWWTLTLVNWDDEPRDLTTKLAALGIGGSKFSAYDVWSGQGLPDLTDVVPAQLQPHECLTVAFRPALPRPQVVGTSRHVVQGAVDVSDERWNASTRSLSARGTRLDGRPYSVTIATPKGWRAGACKAEPACAVRASGTGQITLDWAAASDLQEVSWSLSFRSPSRSTKAPR